MQHAQRTQLKLNVLRLRMEYLALKGQASREHEQTLLHSLARAVRELEALPAAASPSSSAPPEDAWDESPQAGYSPISIPNGLRLPSVASLVRAGGEAFHDLVKTREVVWFGNTVSGLHIVASFRAVPGETVALDLGLPDGELLRGIRAVVRWCWASLLEPKQFVIGLRLIDASASTHDRLRSLRTRIDSAATAQL